MSLQKMIRLAVVLLVFSSIPALPAKAAESKDMIQLQQQIQDLQKENAEMRKQIEGMTAFGRFGEPSDIAEVVHFLASPAGRWVTGQTIEASGGFNM